jgi:hypothetical protein
MGAMSIKVKIKVRAVAFPAVTVKKIAPEPEEAFDSQIIFQDASQSSARAPRSAFLVFQPSRQGCFP